MVIGVMAGFAPSVSADEPSYPRITDFKVNGYLYDKKISAATMCCSVEGIEIVDYESLDTEHFADAKVVGEIRITVKDPQGYTGGASGAPTGQPANYPDILRVNVGDKNITWSVADGFTDQTLNLIAHWVEEEQCYKSLSYANGANIKDDATGEIYAYVIVVTPAAQSASNTAPVIKEGIGTSGTAETTVGKAWQLDLTTIFEDADNDPLTYKVKIGSAEAVAADANYVYTPDTAGNVTLVFTANDGKADSNTYTVTLTVKEASASIPRITDFKVNGYLYDKKISAATMCCSVEGIEIVDYESLDTEHFADAKVVGEIRITVKDPQGYTGGASGAPTGQPANYPDILRVNVGDKNITWSVADGFTDQTLNLIAHWVEEEQCYKSLSYANGANIKDDATGEIYAYVIVVTPAAQSASNTAPVIKEGIGTSGTAETTVGKAWQLDLTTIFEDADNDPLTYKVKIGSAEAVAADANYVYTPDTAGNVTLVFTANDGKVDSLPYTVTLTVKPVQPENYAPAIKGSVTTNPTTESITVQKEWCINLFDVFEDVENDPLTFKYRINNDVFVDTDSSFRYIPDDIGTYTIEFKANDGHSDSEAYIVYLEVNDGTFSLVLDNAPWGIARISINGEEVELIKNDLNSLRTTETVKAGSFVEVYYCPYKTSDDIKDLSYVSVSRYPDGALHQLGTVTGPFTGNFTMPEHDTKVWMYYDKDPEKPRFNIVGLPDPKFGIDTIPNDSDIAVVKIVNEDGNAVTQAEAGELLTITATSKDTEAYRFDHWECPVEGIVTDENRTLSSFSFVMPAESILPDNPIKAVFKAVGSDVSIETNDVSAAQVLLSYLGGSIEAKENNIPVTTTVMSGKEVTAIVSNLNEAYKYDWLVTKSAEGVVTDITSDVVVNGQPKFTVDGTSNYSVKAIFTAKDYGYVIVNVNDSKMGTATALVGSGTSSTNLDGVIEGSTVKLNAFPLEGYVFKGWTASYGDSATAVEITDADKEDASFVMPATNHAVVNVVATFEKDPAFASHETVLEDVELINGDKTYPADQDDTTFTITLPDDVDTADLASWKLAFTVSEGATVTKGDQTFSSGDACGMQLNTPATFVVTAEDKDTKQEYTVVINGKEAPTIEDIAEETGTGWFQVEEKWYYAENGKLQKGWKKPGSIWYYLDPETGEMQTGIQTINGAKYYLDPNGAMKTGWIKDDGTWYFAKDSGALVTGWLQVGSTWYYLNPETCVMETGWVKVNGTWYYMKESGAMATGWVKDGDTWYYMNTSGAMVTGWVKVNNTWYYMKSSGAMAANEWCDGYWLNANGSWTYQPRGSWKQNSTGWWFGDTSGWYAKSTTQKINGVNYTFNAAGYWVQ